MAKRKRERERKRGEFALGNETFLSYWDVDEALLLSTKREHVLRSVKKKRKKKILLRRAVGRRAGDGLPSGRKVIVGLHTQ